DTQTTAGLQTGVRKAPSVASLSCPHKQDHRRTDRWSQNFKSLWLVFHQNRRNVTHHLMYRGSGPLVRLSLVERISGRFCSRIDINHRISTKSKREPIGRLVRQCVSFL